MEDEYIPYVWYEFITEKEKLHIKDDPFNTRLDYFYIAPDFEILIDYNVKHWEKHEDKKYARQMLRVAKHIKSHIGKINMIILTRGNYNSFELDIARDVAFKKYNIKNCSINYFDKEYADNNFKSLSKAWEFIKTKSSYPIHAEIWTDGYFDKVEGLTEEQLSKPIDVSKRKITPCEPILTEHSITIMQYRQLSMINRIKNNEFNKED